MYLIIVIIDVLANWCRFDQLSSALESIGSVQSALDVLQKLNFPIDDDSLSSIMIYCASESEIDVAKFLKIIDWRRELDFQNLPVSPEMLEKINSARERAATSYRMHDADLNSTDTSAWRRLGAPSVRSDLPPPRIRRVDDAKNYGDEGNAGLLISPSICESMGVYQTEIYQKRPRAEIDAILDKMGVAIDQTRLDEVWQTVAGKFRKKVQS